MQIKKLLSPARLQQNLAQTSASEEQVSTFFLVLKTFNFFIIKCGIHTQHYCGCNNFFVEKIFKMSGKVGRNCHCLPSEVSYFILQ